MFYFACKRKGHLEKIQGQSKLVESFGLSSNSPELYKRFDKAELLQLLTIAPYQASYESYSLNYIHPDVYIVSWSRLDNRNDLADKIGISIAELCLFNDPHLICLAWGKWGESCVDHLVGDFSFVIYDKVQDTVFCARDHFGVRPLYYCDIEGTFFCATSMRALLESFNGKLHLNQQWIVDYMCEHSMSFEATICKEIKKLKPGHSLSIRNDEVRCSKYYSISLQQPLVLDDSRAYIEVFQEQLKEAVKCRLVSTKNIGCEISGGLDSSGIAGIAASYNKKNGGGFQTFGFFQFEKDQSFIHEVLEQIGNPAQHLISWDSLNRKHNIEMDYALDVLGHPVEHESCTFPTPFYRMAQENNVGVLLSGFGGDEFVTNIQHHLVVNSLLSNNDYRELFNSLSGNVLTKNARILKLLGKKWLMGRFAKKKVNSSLSNAFELYWSHFIVNEEIAKFYKVKERYFERVQFDAGYSDLHRFLVEKRWQPFIPTRMESCSVMAASFGVDYRWPLMDKRLIELYLSIPQRESYRNGLGRKLYREAIKEYVPESVYQNPGKNMGGAIVTPQQFYIKEQHIPLDDLHDLLKEILDVESYKKQIRNLQENEDDVQSHYFYARNIRKVVHLQKWIQKYSKALT